VVPANSNHQQVPLSYNTHWLYRCTIGPNSLPQTQAVTVSKYMSYIRIVLKMLTRKKIDLSECK